MGCNPAIVVDTFVRDIERTDFGSNQTWTTADKNYWPGNNGYVYRCR